MNLSHTPPPPNMYITDKDHGGSSVDGTATLSQNQTAEAGDSANSINDIINWLWYVIPPTLLLLGTFGNGMIVAVMRGMRASQSTACLSVYFTALALSDQCLLTSSVLWFWVDVVLTWPPSFFYQDLLCALPKFIWYASSLTSAWFLVALTYQRVTSVVAPHRVGVLCTARRGKMTVAAIVIAASVLNLHFVFTWSYWPEHGQCLSREQYANFHAIFTWVDLLLASILPFLLLITGNGILIRQVAKSLHFSRSMKHGGDAETGGAKLYPMTLTLILTSSAFLLLTFPTCFFVVYENTVSVSVADEEFTLQLNVGGTVAILLWFGNSAVNFYLYVLSGRKFREETKRCLWRWGGTERKHSSGVVSHTGMT